MNSPLNYLNQILELALSQEQGFNTAYANYCWSLLPNQPVNFFCGSKPEYLKKTDDFWKSIAILFT